jgi:hypothetical protein
VLPWLVLQAVALAEDELLLLWSSVQKEQAAALARRQQQQVHSLPASTNSITAGAAAAVAGIPACTAPASAFTLDESEGLDMQNMQLRQPLPGKLTAAGAKATIAVPRSPSSSSSSKAAMQQPGILAAGPVARHQHGEEDSQHQQLLDFHQHDSNGQLYSSARPGQRGDGNGHGSSSSSSRPRDLKLVVHSLTAWVKSWLRTDSPADSTGYALGNQDDVAVSSAGGATGRRQQQQQQQGLQAWQQCEPGQEANVLLSLYAMLCDIAIVARGPERPAFLIAAALAVLDQATASTAVINYAPEVLLHQLGVAEAGSAILYPAVIAVTKCVGVGLALLVVDAWGRRPLLIWGGIGAGTALVFAAVALAAGSVAAFLICLCLFIFCFSTSWAGLYWVVVSEIFSMGAKSPATSAATSLLFLTGAVVNFVFLTLVGWLGPGAFGIFAAVAVGSSWYVYRAVPETKGRTLAEIQALLAAPAPADSGAGGNQSTGVAAGNITGHARWRGWDWGKTATVASDGAVSDIRSYRQRQQQQQQGLHSPRGIRQQQQGGDDDEVEQAGLFWQSWLQRQQQQQQGLLGSSGLALPLGLELTSANSRRQQQAPAEAPSLPS